MTENQVDATVDSGDADGDGTTEKKFPKIKVADEDTSIVHYSPKAHESLDPSKRDF